MIGDPVYLTVGVVLLLASAVAGLWTLRADRRILLAFALVNLLAAAVIFSTAWPG